MYAKAAAYKMNALLLPQSKGSETVAAVYKLGGARTKFGYLCGVCILFLSTKAHKS